MRFLTFRTAISTPRRNYPLASLVKHYIPVAVFERLQGCLALLLPASLALPKEPLRSAGNSRALRFFRFEPSEVL
jgi:hypothetical protein